MRSRRRCSMCPAIHISSRSWLRSSSTREPSDPPLRGVYAFFSPTFARSRAAGAGGEGETLSLSVVRDGSLEVCGPGRPSAGRPAVGQANRWPASGSLSRRLPRLCASGTRQAPREKRSLVFLLVVRPRGRPRGTEKGGRPETWGAGARRCVVRSSRVFSVEKPPFR